MGLDLAAGGHLTHGSPVNMSGKWFKASHYTVRREDQIIDMDEVGEAGRRGEAKADHRRRIGLFASVGFQALSRDRRQRRRLSAWSTWRISPGSSPAACMPSPVPHAHVTTTTTHKSLRGPRGGLILSNDEAIAKKLNSAIFPGLQGGPLMHVIAAKAVAFAEALRPDFKVYAKNVVENAKALAEAHARPWLRHRLRRHRQPSDAGRSPAEGPEGQRVGEGAGPRGASPATRTASRSIRKSRSSPRGFGSARRRRPRAASASPNSSRSPA